MRVMKKFFSVIGYFIMSVLLFLGGVLLDASPSADIITDAEKQVSDLDDTEDANNATDFDNTGDTDGDGNNASESEPFLYYYSLLDDTEKGYYDQLSEAVASEEESVMLQGITYEEADPIFVSVQYDHPEYFWCEGSYTYRNGDDYVQFIFNYNCTGEEKENREKVIEQQADEILADMPSDSSDYEKVKYVFETLVDRTDYDKAAPENQNIYSVFGNWTTVCAGYAKATKYLLDQMGVDCIYVTGTAGEFHAWNIVNCDGKYYYVDTTWGDPTYQEGIGVDVNTIAYEYLCCPGQMLLRTHTPDAAFPLPECTDTSLEYYRLEERYLTSADEDAILNIMEKDIDENAERTDIQFSDQQVYDQVMTQLEAILQEAMAYETTAKGEDAGGVSYQYNENTCKITVFWNE